jgi:hypothetical protein
MVYATGYPYEFERSKTSGKILFIIGSFVFLYEIWYLLFLGGLKTKPILIVL